MNRSVVVSAPPAAPPAPARAPAAQDLVPAPTSTTPQPGKTATSGERLTDPRFARLNRGLLGFRVALYISLCATLLGIDPRPGLGLFLLLGVLALIPAIQIRALERFRVETGVSISLLVALMLWWRYGSQIAFEMLPLFSLAVSGLLLSKVRAAVLAASAAAIQAVEIVAHALAYRGYRVPLFHPIGDRSQLYARLVMFGLVSVVGVAFLKVGAILRDYQVELALKNREEVRLTEVLRHKNSLINAVAHELRTPLTAVLGLSLVLGDRQIALKDEDRWSLAHTVADESRRLANVIENLVVEARSEATGLATTRESVDLGVEVASVWQQLDPPPEWKFELRGDGQASADRLRTRHLIKNLLDNSVRHGRSPVVVQLDVVNGQALASFRDAGGGIDPEVEERLFGEYEPEGATNRAGATGLGLRIARILARYMGGDLRYAEGAFVLSLPTEGVEQ